MKKLQTPSYAAQRAARERSSGEPRPQNEVPGQRARIEYTPQTARNRQAIRRRENGDVISATQMEILGGGWKFLRSAQMDAFVIASRAGFRRPTMRKLRVGKKTCEGNWAPTTAIAERAGRGADALRCMQPGVASPLAKLASTQHRAVIRMASGQQIACIRELQGVAAEVQEEQLKISPRRARRGMR